MTINQFIESQYQLDAELEQKYGAYLEDLQKESEKFCIYAKSYEN